jgi:transcriptional regulator with XRE-family HTH domain
MISLRDVTPWRILPVHPASQEIASELMIDTLTLGSYLRRERERRGMSLRTISDSTKVSFALLEGLEADDISRWPGGIFRRAFVRSYAQCIGLNPEEVVQRFERQFPPEGADPAAGSTAETTQATATSTSKGAAVVHAFPRRADAGTQPPAFRTRLLGTAADLTVAMVLAFGCAAAGSRLLWPVLLIACYYAAGVLLSGTSPLVALLGHERAAPLPLKEPAATTSNAAESAAPLVQGVQPSRPVERRHPPRRSGDRPARQRRGIARV